MMEDEKILLNLLKRVSILEEEVENLKNIREKSHKENVNKNVEAKSSGKKFPKDFVIKIMQKHLEKIKISKRSSKDGGGLLLTYPNGTTKTALLKSSRNYAGDKLNDFYDFQSWFTLEVIDSAFPFDFYIFSIENINENLDFMIFSNKQLQVFLNKKLLEKNNKYHFYFSKEKNGAVIEDRGETIDVQKYFNNWSEIKKY